MNKEAKFNVDLSFADLLAISDALQAAYRGESYYANLSDEDCADTVNEDGEAKSHKWQRDEREKARTKRNRLSDLRVRLTGEPITND